MRNGNPSRSIKITIVLLTAKKRNVAYKDDPGIANTA